MTVYNLDVEIIHDCVSCQVTKPGELKRACWSCSSLGSCGSCKRLDVSVYPWAGVVRLRSAADIKAESNPDHRYLALGHCWGTDRFLTLNKSNIESFQQGLEAGGLTKTFQEAIWGFASFGLTACVSSKILLRTGLLKLHQ